MPDITIARQFGPRARLWAPPAPINLLLDHPDRKQALELSSYANAEDTSCPRTAELWRALMPLVLARALSAPRLRAA